MHQSRIAKNIYSGIENLLLHKMRSFLTMLGIVFGVASVVAMLAVGEGASRQALREIEKLGSRNIIINSIKPVEVESSGGQRSIMNIYGLTYLDSQRLQETFEHIQKIAPAKLIRKDAYLDTRKIELRIVGTTPKWFELVPRKIIAGRNFSRLDNKDFEPVVVLTEFGARKLLATKDAIGQIIKLGGERFRVIGIIKSEESQGGNVQIPDSQIDAYAPLETVKKYFGDVFFKRASGNFTLETVELHQIIAQVDSTENVEAIAKGMEVMLKKFHKNVDYQLSVPLALLKQAQATERTFNIVLGAIASISLLVGGIGIMNIMLASVTERTREIGIRRAIGAKRSQIISQFLIETIVLSTIGGFVGVVVGITIPAIITYFAKMPTIITAGSIILPLVISVAVGIIFGIYPAASAAKVDPIIALRHE